MDAVDLRRLIAGEVDSDEAVRLLRALPFADVGNARVDHHQTIRQGLPEAAYGPRPNTTMQPGPHDDSACRSGRSSLPPKRPGADKASNPSCRRPTANRPESLPTMRR